MAIEIHPSSTSSTSAWDRIMGREYTLGGVTVTLKKRAGYVSPITRDGEPYGEIWQDSRGYTVVIFDGDREAQFGVDYHGGWGLAYDAAARYAKGKA